MGETITTTVLRMIFIVENGKTTQWNLPNPKTGITKTEVETFMNRVINDEAILYQNQEAVEIKDAYIYQTNKIDLT